MFGHGSSPSPDKEKEDGGGGGGGGHGIHLPSLPAWLTDGFSSLLSQAREAASTASEAGVSGAASASGQLSQSSGALAAEVRATAMATASAVEEQYATAVVSPRPGRRGPSFGLPLLPRAP